MYPNVLAILAMSAVSTNDKTNATRLLGRLGGLLDELRLKKTDRLSLLLGLDAGDLGDLGDLKLNLEGASRDILFLQDLIGRLDEIALAGVLHRLELLSAELVLNDSGDSGVTDLDAAELPLAKSVGLDLFSLLLIGLLKTDGKTNATRLLGRLGDLLDELRLKKTDRLSLLLGLDAGDLGELGDLKLNLGGASRDLLLLQDLLGRLDETVLARALHRLELLSAELISRFGREGSFLPRPALTGRHQAQAV